MDSTVKVRYRLAAFFIGCILLIVTLLAALFSSGSTVLAATTFSNPTPISINVWQLGGSNPYPSNIPVSGLTGAVSQITVTLNSLSHGCVQDVDILLVGPRGQDALIMSDIEGGTGGFSNCPPANGIVSVTLTLNDAASSFMPSDPSNNLTTGTYKPTNYGSGDDVQPVGLPPNSGQSMLSVFNGSNPNGTWKRYVVDDGNNSINGTLEGGWSLTIETVGDTPQTFVVNSEADPGTGVCDATECTLREAILAANGNSGHDNISFSIPGTGVHSIALTFDCTGTCVLHPMPGIYEEVTIDGYTQDSDTVDPTDDAKANTLAVGNDAKLLIELTTVDIDPEFNGLDGLYLTPLADGSIIRGLVINNYSTGIFIDQDSDGNTIEGNFIGTNPAGTSGITGNGVGIFVNGSNNTIGGTAPAARNLISGSGAVGQHTDYTGILFNSVEPAAGNNTVQGNYIGTNISGTLAIPNYDHGITDSSGGDNTIGGTAAGAGNLISGNPGYGILVVGGPTVTLSRAT